MEPTDPSAQPDHLPRGAAESNLPSCPHSTGTDVVTRQHSRKSSPNPKMEDSTSPPFHANPPFSKSLPLFSFPPSLPRIKRSFLIDVVIGTIPFTKGPSFCTSPLCFQPIKAANRASPESVQRTFFSSLLPPLCSSISFIKSGNFLLISILGNPRAPNAGNKSAAEGAAALETAMEEEVLTAAPTAFGALAAPALFWEVVHPA